MDGKQILGFLNYMAIAIVFILGLAALFLPDQKKKLTYLFLMYLCAGLMSFLFFAGLPFILPAISIIGFCIILYLFVQNQEFFSTADMEEKKSYFNKSLKGSKVVVSALVSVLIISAGLFLFYIFTMDFYKNINLVANFNTATLQGVIKDISANYVPLIFIFISTLFMSVVWFIAILKRESKKN